MWWKVCSATVVFSVLFFAFTVGTVNSVYVSKRSGLVMLREDVVFPVVLERQIVFYRNVKFKSTAYSRFLGHLISVDTDDDWACVMSSENGILFSVNPLPDLRLRYLIVEPDDDLIFEFLTSEQKEDEAFRKRLSTYFSNLPDSVESSFRSELNNRFLKWKLRNYPE